MDDFLTVAEFAEAVGVSKQAVYKRLRNKDIEKYIIEKDGVKYISVSAIPLFGAGEAKEKTDTKATEETIDFFKAQIEQKDKIIAELQSHIIEQSKTLSAIVEKQNELQSNYQILLAKIYDGKILLTEPKEQAEAGKQEEIPVEQPLNNGLTTVEQPEKQTIPAEKKRGFFARLFNRH